MVYDQLYNICKCMLRRFVHDIQTDASFLQDLKEAGQ